MSHRDSKPVWSPLTNRRVNQAQRDLASKARLAAKIKALYSIENRAKFVEGGKAGV